MKNTILKFFVAINVLLQSIQIECCNENVCGSIVSKCLLTEACGCTLENCLCCKDCFACLGDVFAECCSCIDLCPEINNTSISLSKTSYVEEFDVKVPHLFMALTELPDPANRWSVLTYPVEFDASLFAPKLDIPLHVQTNLVSLPANRNLSFLTCTVVYMSTCRSMDKCKRSCQSMGASSIRWFHDGCCECIGDTCINYGVNESKCQQCGRDIEEADYYETNAVEVEADYKEVEDEYLDYKTED